MKIPKPLTYILPPLLAVIILATLYYFFVIKKVVVLQPAIHNLLPAPAPQVPEAPLLAKTTSSEKILEGVVKNPQTIEHPTPLKSLPQPVLVKKEETSTVVFPPTLTVVTSIPPKPEKKVHYISIEKNKFVPDKMTVNLGDAVIWTNNDTELHWPASDPHPTHTSLIDFDVGSDLASGETYSYVFRRLGKFAYHDHTAAVINDKATMVGVVEVIASPQ